MRGRWRWLIAAGSGIAAIAALGADNIPTTQPQPGANLVVNGDFEEPGLQESYQTLDKPDALTGWTLEEGRDIDLVGDWWEPAHGKQSLDLMGLNHRGVIHQDLVTDANTWYLLRFAVAANPDNEPEKKAMEVEWGGKLVAAITRQIGGHTRQAMGWEYHDFRVKAAAGKTRLSFIGVSPAPWGMALDDVSVRRDPDQHDVPTTQPAPN